VSEFIEFTVAGPADFGYNNIAGWVMSNWGKFPEFGKHKTDLAHHTSVVKSVNRVSVCVG